ncbi:hypothetical protein P7C71_g3530, partial [Lecanoromycetidae sp. Uapishka_2]
MDLDGSVPVSVQDLLENLIPQLSRLDEFHWLWRACLDYNKITDNLCQYWPNVRLYMRETYEDSFRAEYQAFKRTHLMLRTLTLKLSNSVDYGEKDKKAVFNLLQTCPNLVSLTLRSYGGAYVPCPAVETDFALFPRLREFHMHDDILTEEELRGWGTNGDWTRLEKITLMKYSFLYHLKGCENTLRSFSLVGLEHHDESTLTAEDLSDVCSRFERLEEVTVIGFPIQLPVQNLPPFTEDDEEFFQANPRNGPAPKPDLRYLRQAERERTEKSYDWWSTMPPSIFKGQIEVFNAAIPILGPLTSVKPIRYETYETRPGEDDERLIEYTAGWIKNKTVLTTEGLCIDYSNDHSGSTFMGPVSARLEEHLAKRKQEGWDIPDVNIGSDGFLYDKIFGSPSVEEKAV